MHRSLLTAAVVFAFAASALAEQVEFPKKKSPGTYLNVTKMKSDQEFSGPQSGKMTMNVTTTTEMTVEKATDEGQKAQVTVKRVQMDASVAEKDLTFDSATDDPSGNPMAKGVAQLVDKSVDVTMDKNGAVTKMEGGAGVQKAAKEMLSQNVPDKPVAVGDKWEKTTKQDMPGGPMNIKTTCTLRKVETAGGHKVAVIDIDGKGSKEAAKPKEGAEGQAPTAGKMEMTMKGWAKIDLTTGQNVESEMTVNADIDMGIMAIKTKSVMNSTTKEGKYVAPKKDAKPAKTEETD